MDYEIKMNGEVIEQIKFIDLLFSKVKDGSKTQTRRIFSEQKEKIYVRDKIVITVRKHCNEVIGRVFLKITDVRIERLNLITEEDAVKEGFANVEAFNEYWNKLYEKDDKHFSVEGNPLVFVITFEVVK